MKQKYEVQILEEDKDSIDYGKWYSVAIEMCTNSRRCGCADREAGLENCSHFFYDTHDKYAAEERKAYYEEQGNKVRIIKK